MGEEKSTLLTRRSYLRWAVSIGGITGLAACVDETGQVSVPTGTPRNRPSRQHAWNEALSTDKDGNIQLPEYHVLLPLRVTQLNDDARKTVESALQLLERAYAYASDGLVFTLGYSSAYFERFKLEPIPSPEPLTEMESPEFDTFDAVLHLASDHPTVVLEAEAALFGEQETANGIEIDESLSDVLSREGPRRTGFVGPGLPAEHTDLEGVPELLHTEAPFFMGFRSGFNESQASEDCVTIQDGPFAGGTTMHIESINLQLRTWFEQDSQYQRIAKMFSPAHADADRVGGYGEKLDTQTGIAGTIAEQTNADARSRGMVGHAQKAARGRYPDGTPRLLRRDFNTVDNEAPGIHFVSLQQRIEDFQIVRDAMTGADLAGSGVGQRLNNGILQYIFVSRRGNFVIPPREKRALPVPENFTDNDDI